MSRLQCAVNWINFSFITPSQKTEHIRTTRQVLSPGREQKQNYFITILNCPVSSHLADDHSITLWAPQQEIKLCNVTSQQGCGKGRAKDNRFPFSLPGLKPQPKRAADKTQAGSPRPALSHQCMAQQCSSSRVSGRAADDRCFV